MTLPWNLNKTYTYVEKKYLMQMSHSQQLVTSGIHCKR